MMNPLEQLDAENRLKALELQSFIVEAPAGAGKTELLTQRYLKLLATVDEPEEIIALTFTNKAAAEMRNRILQSLLDCESNSTVTQPHKLQTRQLATIALKHAATHGWQLLTQPSRLRIVTMDALCSSLARQMPLLSRLGGQPRVVDDASLHYAEAAQLALAEVANEASLQAPISAVLGFMHNDIEKLSKLLANMLAKREQWLHLAGQQSALQSTEIATECQQALQYCIEEKLQSALHGLPASIQTMLMPAARFAASNLDKDHAYAPLLDWETPLEAKLHALPNWLALRNFLLTDGGTFRKRLTVDEGFPPDKTGERDRYKQLFSDVCELIGNPETLVTLGKLPLVTQDDLHENSKIVQAFAALLQLAAAHLWGVFQAANEVDFVAIARSAIDALENEQGATDLALKLDYKISHLLVDEFQDTNATQMALLEQLTQGWEPHDTRTLFCVGDPMQSIYRFRKADVSLFLHAAESGVGHVQLTPLKLSRNNRSQPAVVDWINHTFDTIFPAQDNTIKAAIQYRKFIASKAVGADEGVELHALAIENDEESDAAKTSEARHVIDIIGKELEKNSNQKIAVLVRSRKHLRELVSEIRRNFAHIKFQALEIEELNQRQTVQDALSLTRALLHRADRVHWLNILRAPWCGLTLADLHALCANNHHATIWQLMQNCQLSESGLSDDGRSRLNHVKKVLAEAFAAQGRMPLRRWLESTWLKLGGASTLINAGDNRDVQAFFDLVEKIAQGNALDFTQLETAMEKLYAKPDISATDQLQFLTIHGAKGLEFDCVILPALNRISRSPESPLMLWEKVLVNGKSQLLAAPFTKKKKNNAPSIYDYIKALETTRANNEIVRLLYVAATRTERKLHLIASAKRTEKGFSPAANSFLSLLWPTFETYFLHTEKMELALENTENLSNFTSKLMRLPAPAIPAILAQAHFTRTNFNSPLDSIQVLTLNLATDCGTLAHLYMEMIANTGLVQWPDSHIDACSQAMCKWLQQQGHDALASKKGSEEVLSTLQTTLQSEDGRWVLQTRPSAANELAIASLENEVFSTKIIDRTFVEAGTRWIIDYKSVVLARDMSEAALRGIAEQYREQLEAYAQLFASEALPIKKAILFLSIGKLVLLSA